MTGTNGQRHQQVDEGRNRRQFVRIAAEALPHLTARVVGGPQVRLIDVSRRGARVETTMPLKPGRPLTIRFLAADTTLTLTGAVVRSSVAVLAEHGVVYHTAVSFAEDLAVCPEAPAADETGTGATAAGDATSRPAIEPDDVMVVRAPDETGDELRVRLLANSW